MKWGGLKLEGISKRAEETNIRLPEMNLMFDLGKCSESAVPISNLFLSHGHLDHIGGIPNYLFERKNKGLPPPHIFCPPSLISPLKKICNLFSGIHHSHYPVFFIPLKPKTKTKICKNVFVEAIPAFHSIRSYAYSLYKSQDQIIPDLSFTGDTSIKLFDRFPILYQSRILLIECSGAGTPEEAMIKGHIHFSQICERADSFMNRHLLLIHTDNEIKRKIRRIPEKLRRRVRIF